MSLFRARDQNRFLALHGSTGMEIRRLWFVAAALGGLGILALVPSFVDATDLLLDSRGGTRCVREGSPMARGEWQWSSEVCAGYPPTLVFGIPMLLLAIALLLGAALRAALRLGSGGLPPRRRWPWYVAGAVLVLVGLQSAQLAAGNASYIASGRSAPLWDAWGPAILAAASCAAAGACLAIGLSRKAAVSLTP
jgi:hypothetical protein